jgi:outer membrane receptor for ferrienterochelin and colicin
MLIRSRGRSIAGVALILSLTLAACAHSGARNLEREDGQAPGGIVLTQQDISDMRVTDAFQAVERAAHHLRIQRTRAGTPEKITQRGVTSFLLSAEILVVVDGTRVQTVVQHLQNIPAQSIRYIQILTAQEASARFGSEASNGVILVRTAAM